MYLMLRQGWKRAVCELPRRWVAVLLLIGIVVMPTQVSAQRETEATNLEIVILLDESGSMWRETDPDDRRGDAVELFINALSVDASSAEYRAAVVTFGDDATLFGNGFVDIKDAAARTALLDQFRSERSNTNGWTNVLAALQTGRDVLNDHRAGFKPIVVLITDGTPELVTANDDFPDEKAAFIQDVQAYAGTAFQDLLGPQDTAGQACPAATDGVPIYTVALRNASAAGDYAQSERDLWQTISATTGGGYEEILPTDDFEFQVRLQTVFFDLLRDWTCVQVERPETVRLIDGSAEISAPIQSISTQAFFSIATSNPSVDVALLDANGTVVNPDAATVTVLDSDDGLQQIWGIQRPEDRSGWAGPWTLQLTSASGSSDDFAIVSRYTVNDDLRVSLQSPSASILPLGAPIALRAAIIDGSSNPLPAGAILEPEAIVTNDDGMATMNIPLTVSQAGVLEGQLPALTELGSYNIEIIAEAALDGERTLIEFQKNVDLATLPYVNVTSLDATAVNALAFNAPIAVQAQVMLGAEAMAVQGVVRAISAELRDPLGNVLAASDMLPDASGVANLFSAEFAPPSQAGPYTVAVNLETQPLGGQAYTSPTQFVALQVAPPPATATPTATPTPPPTPTATPTPMPTATPRPPLVEQLDIPPMAFGLCGALLLIPLLGLVGVLFVRNRPNLEGVYIEDLSHAGNDVVFGRDIGGRKLTVYDHDGSELAKLRVKNSAEGVRIDVLSLDPETDLLHTDFAVDVGDAFYPADGDLIKLGSIRLQFRNESEDLFDDY